MKKESVHSIKFLRARTYHIQIIPNYGSFTFQWKKSLTYEVFHRATFTVLIKTSFLYSKHIYHCIGVNARSSVHTYTCTQTPYTPISYTHACAKFSSRHVKQVVKLREKKRKHTIAMGQRICSLNGNNLKMCILHC